jgi:ribosome-associated protein
VAEAEFVRPPDEDARAHGLARRAAELMLDKKALDVVLLDVRGMTSYADWFVLGSGESERQVGATAEHLREKLREEGYQTIGSEGFETGHWVLLDYGEVVVHLFSTEVRAFYDLDGLWADAPKEKVA